MEFTWVAIGLGDVAWLLAAFLLGYVAKWIGLPPLIGYLAAGFWLGAYDAVSGEMLEKLSDLGITLLLFTIGLKLNVRMLLRPQVYAVTLLHMAVVVGIAAASLLALAAAGAAAFAGLEVDEALLIAFALSFSSTVYVAKVLEERGQVSSLHGRIAISILVIQDLAAVVFLATSSGGWPSPLALLLFGLIPLRPAMQWLLRSVGHGELLVLYGFVLALGVAELFELVGLKGDLGALAAGVLIAGSARADELAKTMFGFKDLFLLGFFMSIGQVGQPTTSALLIGALLTPLIFVKSGLFFALMTAGRLRARTALLASLNLANFSEFGLIVAALGVRNDMLDGEWLIVLALALALSFVVSALVGTQSSHLYLRYRELWRRLQRAEPIPEDGVIHVGDAETLIVGLGGVGTGAYDAIERERPGSVVGVDIDPVVVVNQSNTGRNVILGDPSDADFWDRIHASHVVQNVMIALPGVSSTLDVVEQVRASGFSGRIAATARFPDQEEALLAVGANTVFNTFTEAGTGFASHVMSDRSRGT